MSYLKKICAIIFISCLLSIYYIYDPTIENNIFQRCPVLVVTGKKCAGCGSQRAIHELLHGRIKSAWNYNPLFVMSLPYLFLGLYAEYGFHRHQLIRLKSLLFGYWASIIWLVIVMSFWIGRNL
jgi:hypothetical protein